MTLIRWGRVLLIWGAAMTAISFAPAALIVIMPGLQEGFFGLVAIMLTLTVTPLGVVIASVGAILLLLAVLRRDRP